MADLSQANAVEDQWRSRFPDTSESARIILPIVFELVGRPNSIVDLGGGIGAWCKVATELGVSRAICIDAPKADPDELLIDKGSFISADLAQQIPDPVKSDLAISLEFAEHVPVNRSEDIVGFLCKSAPIVLFSASIPGQPGVGHINEQPPKFWKDQFDKFGYRRWDIIRPRIINETGLPYWFRQNCYIFASEKLDDQLRPLLERFYIEDADFELVHDSILKHYRAKPPQPGMKAWLRAFPNALRTTIGKRLLGN